jgi:hypothetical protein
MFDIIVKGGTLPDGRVLDIGIQGTRITAMEKNLDIQAQTAESCAELDGAALTFTVRYRQGVHSQRCK